MHARGGERDWVSLNPSILTSSFIPLIPLYIFFFHFIFMCGHNAVFVPDTAAVVELIARLDPHARQQLPWRQH